MIKLIVSDMDGTLLNRLHTVSAGNLAAIDAAKKAGVQFMIATGRGYESIHKLQNDLGFTCPCILVNGAELREEDGTIVKGIPMSNQKVEEVYKLLLPNGYLINLMSDQGNFVVASREKFEEEWIVKSGYYNPESTLDERLAYFKESGAQMQTTFADSLEEILEKGIQIYKMESFYPDETEVIRINEKLRALGGLAVASAGPFSIEVTDEKASKGAILEAYVEEIGLKEEEVAVFGDSYNDASMFERFSNSYAPANAMEEIKGMVKEVVPSNHEDGVGKTILRLLEHI